MTQVEIILKEKNHEELKKFSTVELVAELCGYRRVDEVKSELDKKNIRMILK